jgi:hypothetical protein
MTEQRLSTSGVIEFRLRLHAAYPLEDDPKQRNRVAVGAIKSVPPARHGLCATREESFAREAHGPNLCRRRTPGKATQVWFAHTCVQLASGARARLRSASEALPERGNRWPTSQSSRSPSRAR